VVKGFSLSSGNDSDAAEGRLLLETVGPLAGSAALLMDRTYEDGLTRLAAWGLRFKAVVPPKNNRVHPWEYDRELYKRRNEVERFFRRISNFALKGEVCCSARYGFYAGLNPGKQMFNWCKTP
jgi:hypothetical protein